MLSTETEHDLASRRAAIGRAVRAGDPVEIDRVRTEYRLAKLEAHIREIVDAAPPLDDDQLGKIAAILTGGKS